MVPYTEGTLYRNFRGRWYPVSKYTLPNPILNKLLIIMALYIACFES